MPAFFGVLAFVAGLFVLSRFLKRRDREGHWEKEEFGTREHQDEGVKFRPMEVPPREPFD